MPIGLRTCTCGHLCTCRALTHNDQAWWSKQDHHLAGPPACARLVKYRPTSLRRSVRTLNATFQTKSEAAGWEQPRQGGLLRGLTVLAVPLCALTQVFVAERKFCDMLGVVHHEEINLCAHVRTCAGVHVHGCKHACAHATSTRHCTCLLEQPALHGRDAVVGHLGSARVENIGRGCSHCSHCAMLHCAGHRLRAFHHHPCCRQLPVHPVHVSP